MTPEGDKEFPNIDLFERCQAGGARGALSYSVPPFLDLANDLLLAYEYLR
jgi:hypothetical protein